MPASPGDVEEGEVRVRGGRNCISSVGCPTARDPVKKQAAAIPSPWQPWPPHSFHTELVVPSGAAAYPPFNRAAGRGEGEARREEPQSRVGGAGWDGQT